MLRIAPVLVLLLVLCACSAQSKLASRAADFYSYMAGHDPKTKYTSFLSPAFRKTLGADSVKAYDAALKAGAQGEVRYPRAKAADIAMLIEGRFALTVVNPELGDVYRQQRHTKWVRVGNGWYMYWDSDAERKAYGAFPVGLKPPVYVQRTQKTKK